MGSDVATQLASYEDPSASDRKVWKIAGYVVLALTAILILVTLVMVRRIKVSRLPVCRACASCAGLPWLHAGLQRAEQPDAEQLLVRMQVAVACIKVASQAVSCMPSILFFPILPFLMVVCLVIYWICVAGYLYSAGTITPTYKDTSSATLLSISVSLRRLLHAMRRSGCDYSIFLTSPVPCQNHCQGGKWPPAGIVRQLQRHSTPSPATSSRQLNHKLHRCRVCQQPQLLLCHRLGQEVGVPVHIPLLWSAVDQPVHRWLWVRPAVMLCLAPSCNPPLPPPASCCSTLLAPAADEGLPAAADMSPLQGPLPTFTGLGATKTACPEPLCCWPCATPSGGSAPCSVCSSLSQDPGSWHPSSHASWPSSAGTTWAPSPWVHLLWQSSSSSNTCWRTLTSTPSSGATRPAQQAGCSSISSSASSAASGCWRRLCSLSTGKPPSFQLVLSVTNAGLIACL